MNPSPIAQGNDNDTPLPENQFAQFSAGSFWVYELVFQRIPGVTQTEVGYSQGIIHDPSYEDVRAGYTGHSEVVRVQYDSKDCTYLSMLQQFWSWHDPTGLNPHAPNFSGPTLNQGNNIKSRHRSGIYFYTPEQEKLAREALEHQQQQSKNTILTEILPAKKFYRAEDHHQQYLSKGGGGIGLEQSTAKGCNDPIFLSHSPE